MKSRESLKIMLSRLLHDRPLANVSSRVAHLVSPPTLHELYVQSALLTTVVDDAVEAIVDGGVSYAQEYAEVRARIAREASEASQHYPDNWAIEEGTGYLLYTLVRSTKPSLAIEVGVADGRSTQVILSALDANESGHLVSVDIKHDVGGAAVGHPRWELRTRTPGGRATRQLRELLEDVEAPGFFFHDAGHTYYEQYADYLVAWERMRPGGILMSDDVDWSWAFIDFARRFALNPVVLTDGRKAAGVVIRTPAADL